MEEIIFRETTTIGIRRIPMERTVLSREVRSVETVPGTAGIKVCFCRRGGKDLPGVREHGKDCQRAESSAATGV